MGLFTQLLTPAGLAHLSPAKRSPAEGYAMTNADRALFSSLTTQVCDSLDALSDALKEVAGALRLLEGAPPLTPKEHILVPPPPLPGPTL
jgi:hypothetical protein